MTTTGWIIIGVVLGLVLLLCLALAVANFSAENFQDKKQQLSNMENIEGLTLINFVDKINKSLFGGRLKITSCEEGQDCYSNGVVALSPSNINSNSLAALATVSHELGHARQDAEGRLDKFWRQVRGGRVCGLFFMPLVLAGGVLSLLWVFEIVEGFWPIVAGCVCFALAFLVFVIAIVLRYNNVKIEKEASDFGIEFLSAALSEDEVKVCREFLMSARLTYWAVLIRTLLGWTRLTNKTEMFR